MFHGNDGGASQFNGGGFMPSPGAQAGGGSAQKKSYDNKSQAVRAVTIKQIARALDESPADAVTVDGKEIANVTLVGKVLSASEDTLTFNMLLDDGTGRCAVKMYASDDSELERQARSELREGIYVRVFGHVGSMGSHERHVVAFSARPITDHNEVTYHLSQVIFQHLHLTKGGDTGGAAPGAGAQFNAAGNGYGAPAGAPAAAMGGGAGHNPVQDEVINIFNAPDAKNIDAGLTVNDIVVRSGNRLTGQQVLAAITFLVDEGHLYSTIDDAHWKSCL